jgi:hypothetical protein
MVIDVKFESLRGGWCSKRCWVLLEWVCGNILRRGGISFVTLFVLRLGLGGR